MMDAADFWRIIDSSRASACRVPRRITEDFIGVHKQTLAEALRKLAPEEIVQFHERYSYYVQHAYRYDLLAVAYWQGGGCGSDGFLDFRSCLISLGSEMFFRIMKDADSLADILDQPNMPCMQAEGFQYVAGEIYREKTGEDLPELKEPLPYHDKPVGREIDAEDRDVMHRHFPKLVEKLPTMGDGTPRSTGL